MDLSILANLFLFLGAIGVNFALDASSGSDSAETDPLYDGADYASSHDGTGGDDDITTMGASEARFLAAGDDQLTGSSGNDYANMGAGDDGSDLGAGNDIALGGAGNDSLAGGSGNDSLFGEADDDSLWGNTGDDSLAGGDGADNLVGGTGSDTLSGGKGDDLLSGYAEQAGGAAGMVAPEGLDQLQGGEGNDTLLMGHGDGAIGGAGADSFIMDHRWNDSTGQFRIVDFDRSADQLQLDYVPRFASDTNIEVLPDLRIELSPDGESSLIRMNGSVIAQLDGVTDLTLDDIQLRPDTTTDTGYIRGTYDGEVIFGDTADAQAPGTTASTAWFMGGGADTLMASAESDYAQLGSGDDQADMLAGDDSVRAGDGDDAVSGGDGHDTIWGQLGDDDISGDAGNDRLIGEEGNDLLTGGAGADSVVGGAGHDTVSGFTAIAGGEDGAATIDGIDTLSGGAGNDTLIIGRGDIVLGGTGNDIFAVDAQTLDNTQIAVINDYMKGEDLLEIHYDPTFDSAGVEVPPKLTILAGPSDAYSVLQLNGEPVAQVMGTPIVTAAEVTLVRAA